MKWGLFVGLVATLSLGVVGLSLGTLSGTWDTTIAISPTATTVQDAFSISSEIRVDYSISGWAFGSVSTIEDAQWTEQEFLATGSVGRVTGIVSSITFVPVPPTFRSLDLTASMLFGEVLFGFDFSLRPHQTGAPSFAPFVASTTLSAFGQAGDVELGATLRLGSLNGCDLDFRNLVLEATFPFCCSLDVSALMAFTCDVGFHSVSFSTVFPVPLGYEGRIVLAFAVQDVEALPVVHYNPRTQQSFEIEAGKNVRFALIHGDAMPDACVEVYGLSTSPPGFSGFAVECSFGNVDFRAETWTESSDAPAGLSILTDARLAGWGNFYEAYQIRTLDPGCCGPFDFDLTFFFNAGAGLFDIALIRANFGLVLADQVKLKMGLRINVEAQEFSEWTIGFLVTWPAE